MPRVPTTAIHLQRGKREVRLLMDVMFYFFINKYHEDLGMNTVSFPQEQSKL